MMAVLSNSRSEVNQTGAMATRDMEELKGIQYYYIDYRVLRKILRQCLFISIQSKKTWKAIFTVQLLMSVVCVVATTATVFCFPNISFQGNAFPFPRSISQYNKYSIPSRASLQIIAQNNLISILLFTVDNIISFVHSLLNLYHRNSHFL